MSSQWRFIPTAVGNAWKKAKHVDYITVHPHGCGERGIILFVMNRYDGSSPRLWGTHLLKQMICISLRFIPTAVGNAVTAAADVVKLAVHPHGCGERLAVPQCMRLSFGSSPRLWGTPTWIHSGLYDFRFIPTAVGNARIPRFCQNNKPVHPHGCGERTNSPILPK